jgi:hypothetical protein
MAQHLEHKQDFLATGVRRLGEGDVEGAVASLVDGIALSDPVNPAEIDFALSGKAT